MSGVKSDFWHVRHDGLSQVFMLMFNSVKTFGFKKYKRILVFVMLLHPQSGPLVVTSRGENTSTYRLIIGVITQLPTNL